jgi:hypothetical protein
MHDESLPAMPFPYPSSTLLGHAGSRGTGDRVVSLGGRWRCSSFEENGAALPIGRIVPGVALRPLDDPAGERIGRCLQRLGRIPPHQSAFHSHPDSNGSTC